MTRRSPTGAAATNLNSIVDTAEGLAAAFDEQQRRARLVRALLIGFIVSALALTVVFAVLVTNYFSGFLNAHPVINGILFVGIAAASLFGAAGAAYSLLSRRGRDRGLADLSALILQIKADSATQATTENGLLLADRILTLLPKVVRKKSEDPVLYGILCAIVALLLSRLAPLAVAVGIAVWLYFRRSMNASYRRGVEKIEGQKRLFDRCKEQYLESL
jgi:hypothetical protein